MCLSLDSNRECRTKSSLNNFIETASFWKFIGRDIKRSLLEQLMCSEIRCHTVSGVLKNNLKIFLDIFQIVPDRSGIAGHLNQAIKLGLPDMSRVENLRCNHQNLQVSHKIRFLSQESIRLSSSHDSQITIPLAIEPSKINVSRVLFSLTGLEFGTTRKKTFQDQ